MVAQRERVESDFVDALPDAPMAPEALQALLGKLAAVPAGSTSRPVRKRLGDVPLPQALAHTKISSRRWILPGLWVAHLPEGREEGWRTYLLRAAAGQTLPHHAHRGPEVVCVLMGALDDGDRYEAGDFFESPAGSSHRLTVTSETPCACLVARKGPIRTQGAASIVAGMADL